MNASRARFIWYLTLTAILVYSAKNVVFSYFDLKAVDNVPVGINDQSPVQQKQPERPSLEKYKAIWEKDLFLARVDGEKAGVKQDVALKAENLLRTSLDLTLVGTIILQGGMSQAVIEDNQSKTQDQYYLGSTISGAKVAKILNDRVILNVDGRDEVLTMDTQRASLQKPGYPPAVVALAENPPVTEPNWDERSSLGYSQRMLKVRLKPYLEKGNQNGFEVKSITDESPLKAVGLMDSDIIQMVNGKPIDSDLDLLPIQDAVNNGDPYTLSVVRDGRPMTLSKLSKAG